jgi:hypothetical protein
MRMRPLQFTLAILAGMLLSKADLHAFQCGPVTAPPMVPVCNRLIVPLAPCCQPSPLFPPPPPIDAPVIVLPEPIPYEACYPQASLATSPLPFSLSDPRQPVAVPPLSPPPRRAKRAAYPSGGLMVSPRRAYGGPSVR